MVAGCGDYGRPAGESEAVGRKGGRVAIGQVTAELVDQLAESVIGVTVTRGGLLLGEAVDEDGAKGIVLALLRTRRFQEEPAASEIVHGLGVECEVMVVGDRSTELPIGEGEGKRGEQPVRRKGWPSSTRPGRDKAFVHYTNACHPVNKPVYRRAASLLPQGHRVNRSRIRPIAMRHK